MTDKDIDKIPIALEVPKADVWLRADYRDIVHRLGEVHMVRACEHQHDDDFVPMYDLQTIAEYQQKAESLRLELDRAWAEVDRCCKHRDRLRELLREAREDVENRKAFCLLISNAQGVGEYTREHTARLAERKKALLVRIDAALGGEGKDDAA